MMGQTRRACAAAGLAVGEDRFRLWQAAKGVLKEEFGRPALSVLLRGGTLVRDILQRVGAPALSGFMVQGLEASNAAGDLADGLALVVAVQPLPPAGLHAISALCQALAALARASPAVRAQYAHQHGALRSSWQLAAARIRQVPAPPACA